MVRRLAITAALLGTALLGVGASQAEVVPAGNLRVKFSANFEPHLLPRDRPAPVRVGIQSSVVTTDGSHPPALQRLEVELHRNGKLTTKGLPVCSAPLLQTSTTDQALGRCGSAVVGRGNFKAQVFLGEDVPTSGRIVAFNSRLAGKPALLLHFFAQVPVRFTLVVPLTISHTSKGEFGTVLRTRVPKLAGGLGSITEIALSLGRRYSFAGKRRSYLAAACGAPAGFGAAIFTFARARFRFASHPGVHSTLVRSCSVRRPGG